MKPLVELIEEATRILRSRGVNEDIYVYCHFCDRPENKETICKEFSDWIWETEGGTR